MKARLTLLLLVGLLGPLAVGDVLQARAQQSAAPAGGPAKENPDESEREGGDTSSATRTPPAEPEASPDFGPGPIGFLAFLLWHAYRVFPFQDAWFGPLLFAGCAVSAFRISFWPFLWRAVRRDMNTLAAGRTLGAVQHLLCFAVEMVGLALLVVFLFSYWQYFGLPHFGEAQERSGLGFGGAVLTTCVALHVCLLVLVIVLDVIVHKRIESSFNNRPGSYPTRDLASLFGGGGAYHIEPFGLKLDPFHIAICTFCWPLGLSVLGLCFILWVKRAWKAPPEWTKSRPLFEFPLLTAIPLLIGVGGVLVFALMAMVTRSSGLASDTSEEFAHTCLWISTVVTLPWLLTEGARMVFVSILHKRTFG